MLHIVGIIFLVLGSILLAILGLLILGVGIVAFVPVRYRVDAESQGKWEEAVFHLSFSWLLYAISGHASFEDGRFQWNIRILWDRKESGEGRVEGKAKKQSPSKKTSEEHRRKHKEKKRRKQKGSTSMKDRVLNICEKIKSLIRGKEELEAFFRDEVHRAGWQRMKREGRRLFRFLKPKRFRLRLHYGFEDVYLTGKVLAFFSVLYPFYGEEIQITPDFERAVLEGSTQIKGRIYGIWLLIFLYNLCRDRNVRTTYRHIKNINSRK